MKEFAQASIHTNRHTEIILMTAHADKAQIDKESFFSRFKTSGSKLFWAWVGYQAVKGTLTTAFIWLPLLYVWLG